MPLGQKHFMGGQGHFSAPERNIPNPTINLPKSVQKNVSTSEEKILDTPLCIFKEIKRNYLPCLHIHELI